MGKGGKGKGMVPASVAKRMVDSEHAMVGVL